MIKNPEFKKYDLSSLRTGIISGSTISDNQYQRIAKAFKQMQLVPAYGMTEGSTLSTICDVDESENIKMNSAGRPLENVKIRIWNCQKSEEAAPGEVGEIQICGETVMQGYYHMPEKTMASMMEHQWFRTTPVISCQQVKLGTLIRLPVINRRKVGMTSNHHALYVLGYTRTTMAVTERSNTAR